MDKYRDRSRKSFHLQRHLVDKTWNLRVILLRGAMTYKMEIKLLCQHFPLVQLKFAFFISQILQIFEQALPLDSKAYEIYSDI